jgi:hypothetical protein
MAFKVFYKTERQSKFKKVGEFQEYKKAYYFVGDEMQEKTNLHWSNLKSMKDGYGKEKLFLFGEMILNNDGHSYKIEEVN